MPAYSNRPCGPGSSAFSLVEMMVATTVAAMLLVVLAGISTQMTQIFTAGLGQSQNRNNARVAMNFISREMSKASISSTKTYPSATDTATQSTLHFVINPTTVTATYKHPDAVFWQAPIATDTTSGTMAEVGYFIQRGTVNGIFQSQLCRLFINPNSAPPRPAYLIYTQPDAWLSDSILSQFVPTRTNSYSGLFLENVLGLWVVPYGDNGKTLTPRGAPGVTDNPPHDFDSRLDNPKKLSGTPIADRLPAMVQVAIVLADSAAMKRYQNQFNSTYDGASYSSAGAFVDSVHQHLSGAASGVDSFQFNVVLD